MPERALRLGAGEKLIVLRFLLMGFVENLSSFMLCNLGLCEKLIEFVDSRIYGIHGGSHEEMP